MPCSSQLHHPQAPAVSQLGRSADSVSRRQLGIYQSAAVSHQRRQRLARATATPRSTRQGSNSGNSDATDETKVGKVTKPNVLHFADPAGSSALFQSVPEGTEQPRQESKPLLGTEASRGAPNASGVKNATLRYDLPTPAVAVRNLVELAQYAHLCTIMSNMHHRRAGYPFGTIVDFASDGAGCPLFCLSPLAIHTRNIMEDPRCSLVVQMPGWTGMANARVTIFGDVYQLPPDMHEAAREIYVTKHAKEKKGEWVSGNLVFFRMHRISDIYFVGGFGTVQWVDVADYMATKPDSIVAADPQETISGLNAQFEGSLKKLLCRKLRPHVDEAILISIDKLGADVRVRVGSDYSVERIGWQKHVHTQAEAMQEMEELISLDNNAMGRRTNVRTRL
ncbi:hypothetical protein ABBQ38_009517 [Trebouxia sp. C0009 RCD-2024]